MFLQPGLATIRWLLCWMNRNSRERRTGPEQVSRHWGWQSRHCFWAGLEWSAYSRGCWSHDARQTRVSLRRNSGQRTHSSSPAPQQPWSSHVEEHVALADTVTTERRRVNDSDVPSNGWNVAACSLHAWRPSFILQVIFVHLFSFMTIPKVTELKHHTWTSSTEPWVQLDLERGIIWWQPPDSRICNATVSDSCWRRIYFASKTQWCK